MRNERKEIGYLYELVAIHMGKLVKLKGEIEVIKHQIESEGQWRVSIALKAWFLSFGFIGNGF